MNNDDYDPSRRAAECPDPDATTLRRIEVDFAIPVEMTQAQQRRLYEAVADIAHAPWNEPAEGVHWLAGGGSKPKWSQADAHLLGVQTEADAPWAGEPTFDDSVFYLETCARGFVSDEERLRKKLARRDHGAPDRPRDLVIAALEAVAHFWGSDPKAFGDDATVTSLAGRFARVADRCRRALAVAREHAAKANAPPEPVSPLDCKHDYLFVQSASGGQPAVREHVSVCRLCGQFKVFRREGGQTLAVTFTLPTWPLVAAAAQFARLLNRDDGGEDRVAQERAGEGRP